MKSRVTTYLLIVAVFGVWGVVAWRLFFSRPDTPVAVPVQSPVREADEPERDFLVLDYKDPFLRNSATPQPSPSTVPARPTPPPGPPPRRPRQTPPPPLRYAGTIEKQGRISYLFDHSGLLHSLSPGDVIEGYTLAEIYPDSARVTKDGELFTLFIQK